MHKKELEMLLQNYLRTSFFLPLQTSSLWAELYESAGILESANAFLKQKFRWKWEETFRPAFVNYNPHFQELYTSQAHVSFNTAHSGELANPKPKETSAFCEWIQSSVVRKFVFSQEFLMEGCSESMKPMSIGLQSRFFHTYSRALKSIALVLTPSPCNSQNLPKNQIKRQEDQHISL